MGLTPLLSALAACKYGILETIFNGTHDRAERVAYFVLMEEFTE
jgi:hypothetical protein